MITLTSINVKKKISEKDLIIFPANVVLFLYMMNSSIHIVKMFFNTFYTFNQAISDGAASSKTSRDGAHASNMYVITS